MPTTTPVTIPPPTRGTYRVDVTLTGPPAAAIALAHLLAAATTVTTIRHTPSVDGTAEIIALRLTSLVDWRQS